MKPSEQAEGLPEYDFIVQMPPIREYTIRVRIISIEKATPHIVGVGEEENDHGAEALITECVMSC